VYRDQTRKSSTATLAEPIRKLETERGEIDAKLATIESGDNIVSLHPATLDRYLVSLDRLAEILPHAESGVANELARAMHNLISAVIVHAPPNSEKLEIEIRGRLEELLAAPTFMRRSTGGRPMVAGEGLEPPTPGL
jgi:site-specific DNA recombinase